jgi:hypothetical protein
MVLAIPELLAPSMALALRAVLGVCACNPANAARFHGNGDDVG